jgi:hypothetical protein
MLTPGCSAIVVLTVYCSHAFVARRKELIIVFKDKSCFIHGHRTDIICINDHNNFYSTTQKNEEEECTKGFVGVKTVLLL